MNKTGTFYAALGVALGASCASHDAHACFRVGGSSSYNGEPADGALGVPIDVILIFSLSDAHVKSFSVLVDLTSASGRVPVTTRLSIDSFMEMVPDRQLDPNTAYSLRVRGEDVSGGASPPNLDEASVDLTISFTTGTGGSSSLPPRPLATMQHYSSYRSESDCDPPSEGTCLALPDDGLYAVTFRPDPNPLLLRGSYAANFTGINQTPVPDCVDIRRRGDDGRLSEPASLCPHDAPMYVLQRGGDLECTTAGLTLDAQPIAAVVPPDGPSGCAVTRVRFVPGSLGWLELFGLALLGRMLTGKRAQ